MGMDRARSIERFLPLRPVEFEVLLSLASGERHGYGIIQDAEARGGGVSAPDVGTLYRALRRMQDQGLIEEAERRDVPDGQERRNYYRITALGMRVARAESRRMSALIHAARAGGLLEEGF
jgi:DNA-binding PadR family transcriptional regulator